MISSLSKRISELELSVGTMLFDRSGYNATLTDAGKRLLPKTLQILEISADIKRQLTQSSVLLGRCVFGVGELAAMTWLPRLVAVIRVLHPHLIIEPYVDVGAVLEERLDRGELDFAVIAGRSSRPGIISRPLVETTFAWMCSTELWSRHGNCRELLKSGTPLVALPPSAGTTRLIDEWLMSEDIEHVERISCNNWSAIVGMLALSVGVGILPLSWAEELAQNGGLGRLDDGLSLGPLAYSFQTRRGDTRPLIQEMFAHSKSVADFSRSNRPTI